MSQYMIEEIDRCLCVCFDRFLMHFYLLSIQYYLLRYVGCWIIDFDQETKIHTLQFTDLHVEKFNLKEEEWHFLLVDSSDEE